METESAVTDETVVRQALKELTENTVVTVSSELLLIPHKLLEFDGQWSETVLSIWIEFWREIADALSCALQGGRDFQVACAGTQAPGWFTPNSTFASCLANSLKMVVRGLWIFVWNL